MDTLQAPNLGFALAAVVAAVAFGIHSFVGSRLVAQPLLAAKHLPPASRWLNFYTWHTATVALAFMAAGFAWAAVRPDALDIGIGLTALAAALAVLCLAVCLRARFRPWRVPPFDLFTLMAVAGLWGLLA